MDQYDLKRYGIDLSAVPGMTYRAFIRDALADRDQLVACTDSPGKALNLAKRAAEKLVGVGASYWVEYDLDLSVLGLGGYV